MKKKALIFLLILSLLLPAASGCKADPLKSTAEKSDSGSSVSIEQPSSSTPPSAGEDGQSPPSGDPSESPSPSPSKEEPSPSNQPSPSPSKEDPVEVDSITLDKTSLTLEEGQTAALQATVLPEQASDKTVTFESSDTTVLTVDASGKISAKKEGSATVTAKSADGKVKATCTVTVKAKIVSVSSITLDKTSLTLEEGQTATLQATVLPEQASDKTVTFESSDTTVLTVDASGKISAKKEGSATVTAKSADGKVKATCTVTVKAKIVSVSSITLDKTSLTLEEGQTATLQATVLPSNATNKKVTFESSNTAVLTVDASGKISAKKAGSATVTAKSADGKVKATCIITVKEKTVADPIDLLNLSGVPSTSDLGGYETTLRVKSTKELLFSPNLPELRNWVSQGASYDDYTAYLRFTYIAADPSEIDHVFPSVKLTPVKSKGAWVDFFLMGDNINCGFCPTAGETYTVEMVLLKAGKPVLKGVYSAIEVPSNFSESPYYAPTPGAGIQRGEGEYFMKYTALAGGSITGTTRQLLKAGQESSAVTATPDSGYIFLCWNDGVKTATRTDVISEEDTAFFAYFVAKPDENSPIANMYLFTDSGNPVTSKNYENAFLVIMGADNEKHNIAVTTEIKGRGNSSWNGGAAQTSYDSKNSYRLKLTEKAKLLGIGDSKNKDWVLNSNKFDLSSLRNYLVWQLAERMGSIPYVPECTWVQLYINGQYRGMYMVSEHVEAANDRVEVDDSVNSPDKGYLIEVDFRGNGENDPYFYINGYGSASNGNEREFVIKSDCTESDIAFIKDYMQKCHDAMVSGNKARIEELIDLPSLIDMYIIEELSKDVDVGAASCFLQKPAGGKLYFTAPWDFDFGFGTYGYAITTDELLSSGNRGCTWFAALVEQEWFRKAVYDRMIEFDPLFEETMEVVRVQGELLEPAADKNALFWNMYGNRYHGYVSSNASSKLHSYDEHIEYLISWSEQRWQTMKKLLNT